MNSTNFYDPVIKFQGPSCPTHGSHQKGWLNYSHSTTERLGVSQTVQICGLCIITLLNQLGYTVTEPASTETLKEDAWILDELPEVKR